MTIAGRSSVAPALARPTPPRQRLSLLEYWRAVRDSWIAGISEDSYDRDIIENRFLWQRTFIVNDPAAIKRILIDNAANYTKTEMTRQFLEPVLGKGLVTSEGEIWRRHRRIMAPSFDFRSLISYAPIMTDVADKLSEKWNATADGSIVDVATEMMQATLTIISRTMFSSDSEGIVHIVERAVVGYQTEVRPRLLDVLGLSYFLPRPRASKATRAAFKELDEIINRLIAERVRNPDFGAKDLLARLVAARDEETGGGMTAQEIRDQIITIFMAGHETTALALTWTWYLLSQHPLEEQKLHAELDRVLGGRLPSHDDVVKLPYTRMIIEESMRLYPPVHTITRSPLADDEVCGHRIPKGSIVLIMPWILHRHRKFWDQPERFDPERFSSGRTASRPRFAYLPFSAGPRVCIGAAFAMTEAVLLLAALAQRFRMRIAPDQLVDPQALITLRPRNGLKIVLERRGK
ncbi:MAG TPA: cytochrome P450 [Xanthobacteraceae bacterium]|jgi:cytochrome P450|nr:cytochrome P450 [Xanthobacteraceae bacterium]